MAATLLHEMAHAANFHIMGLRPEDFFEDALVSEAGYDYESRIFGMVPDIIPTDLPGSAWKQWQNSSFLVERSYSINEHCRNAGELATSELSHPFDAEFAKRLLDDEWWVTGKDRSADLIPEFLLRKENAHLLATKPASFRKWVRCGTTRAFASVQHKHETTKSLPSRLKSRLRFRQPTPPSSITATMLEFDPPPIFEYGILHYAHTPIPFPQSAEYVRRIISYNDGIDALAMGKLLAIPHSLHEGRRFTELIWEISQFDEMSERWVLREDEEHLNWHG